MKRTIGTIKQCDYTSENEFKKDIPRMKAKGYALICDGMFNNVLNPRPIDDDTWKFTASFVKSDMM